VTESDLSLGDRVLRVRDAGDPGGNPVVFFHATPGSRLDMAFADDLAAETGVRLVSFDRPGYGGSTPARFGLRSVAEDAEAVADELGIGRFATLGQSGGGAFSLAAAGVLGDRVIRAGVASGPGPFTLVPGGLEMLDDGDTAALALLPDDPEGAARGFAAGFEPLVDLFRDLPPAQAPNVFDDLLSPRDRELMGDERLATAVGESLKEALRQGVTGGGWDNVAWVGPWEVDPTSISRPVLLWYGDEDRFAPLAHATWLHDNLPDSELVVRPGEGHLGFLEHATEMFRALTADAS
jgi:pimeloyl-ACP methyl ester carboxylesterase